jgi:hypothetical protein
VDYSVIKAERVFSPPEVFSVMLTLKDPNGFTPAWYYRSIMEGFSDTDVTNINDKKIWYAFRIFGEVGASYVIDIAYVYHYCTTILRH